MSELVSFTGNDAASKLVQWAEAASAAQSLAQQLCKTAFVPETFRLVAGESEEVRNDNDKRIGNATAALLLGAELGLDPIASLRALYVIRGQVAIYARMKLALLLSRGHRVWTEFESDERIVVAGHRKDDEEHIQRVTWDVERAKRAGFTRNELYRTNPRAMLFARASSELASRIAPDVLAGIPEESAEELGARVSAPADVPGGNVTLQRSPRPTEAPTRLLAPVQAADELPVPQEKRDSAEQSRRRALKRAQEEKTTTDVELPQEEETAVEEEITIADRTQEEVLPIELPEEEPKITSPQRAILHALFRAQGWNQDTYREFTRQTLGRKLETTNELTVTEASFMIEHMKELSGEAEDENDEIGTPH
jgi:hypothetical protein